MGSVRESWSRIRALLRRSELDADMAEQMRIHIELQAEANERGGMSPAEALRAARVQFGSVERFRAECRDERRFGVLEDAAHDARFALRGLVGERSFSVAALLALAIGVGAATTIYSLADHVLLRPVSGVERPADVATVLFQRDSLSGTGISYANLMDLATATPAFTGMAGIASGMLQSMPEGGKPLMLEGDAVTYGYFDLLGARPALGRFFSEEEAGPHAVQPRVAVISHGTWQSVFGGAADVLGRTLRLNTHEFVVIGVAQRGFTGHYRLGSTDVWLPAMAYEAVRHFPPGMLAERRGGTFQEVVARLAPGASAEQAQAQLRAAMAALIEQYPRDNAVYERNIPTVHAGIGTPPRSRSWLQRTMKVLGGAAGLLLFIACANVANLQLFRAMRRRTELSVRRALGAGTARLARQNLVEGLLLATAGTVAGLLLAQVAVWLLRRVEAWALPPLDALAIDGRIIAFVVVIVLATGLFFGLMSAWWSRGSAIEATLRRGRTGTYGFGRSAFTVVQVAASVILLAGALLLVRSVDLLRDVDAGMDPDGVSVFGVMLDPQGYDAPRKLQFLRSLMEQLAVEPRFDGVAVASGVPVIGANRYSGFRRPDTPEQDVAMQMLHVSDGYFPALGIRLLAGRGFTREEAFAASGEIPVVISETAARELFGSVNAIGQRIVASRRTPEGTMVVVGVSDDVMASLRRDAEPALFLPHAANAMPFGANFITVRSRRPVHDVQAAVESAVASLEPALPFWISGTLRERVDETLATERLMASILSAFALLAVLLATIGVYGIVSYSAAQQRREIGIRSALGAQPLHLAGIAARGALLATGIGVVLGIGGAVSASRLLESWLFGVDRLSPTFYLAATLGFILLSTVAAALPARGAATVRPLEVLRLE